MSPTPAMIHTWMGNLQLPCRCLCRRLFGILVCVIFLTDGLGTVSFANDAKHGHPGNGLVAYAGSLTGDKTQVRLQIDFDREANANIQYMASPHRIIVNLPRTAFKFPQNAEPEAAGMVDMLQFGTISRDHSRLVLGLNRPAIVKSKEQRQIGEGQSRLTMELVPISGEEYAALIRNQQEISGTSGAVAKKGDRVRKGVKIPGQFTVVIDPGHGGIDGGATGKKGTIEKRVTLQAAKMIKEEIEKLKNIKVLMTRNDDVFVSLKERLEFTRLARADLFLSIHADSLSQRHVRGATIYTLSKKASDSLSEKLAETVNLADLVAGLAVDDSDDAVTDILVDLTAQETVRFSRIFSRIVTQSLKQGITLIKNPQRSAAFGVLKAPEVPGVLLELGYLSNLEDEKLMRSTEWQRRLATLVGQAVAEFFRRRS